jgi:hypothetical protein
MSFPLFQILAVIVGVAGVTVTLVGPLYYLVLDLREEIGGAEEARDNLAQSQSGVESSVSTLREEMQQSHKDVQEDIQALRQDVHENALRAEQNQRHIHQLLVGDHNGDDGEMGNPHHRAEHCPLPDECPWH